jgi:hypothetical protein
MPSAWNSLEPVELITAVIEAHAGHRSGRPREGELSRLKRIVELPGAREFLERGEVHHSNQSPDRELLRVSFPSRAVPDG